MEKDSSDIKTSGCVLGIIQNSVFGKANIENQNKETLSTSKLG